MWIYKGKELYAVNKYQNDISYMIAIDSLEKEVKEILLSNDLSQDIIDRVNELERAIKDIKRDRELNKGRK